jgi:hypothetical protein
MDALSFDDAGGLVVALAVLRAAGLALACSFVLDAGDGEPEQLDHGVVGREVAAGPGDLAPVDGPPTSVRASQPGRISCL